MESLMPELAGFTPRASTSSSTAFALDPALAGPGPSSSRAHRGGDDAYWDDEDDLEYADEGAAYDDDQSEDETDAEDEYAAATQGSGAAGRGRKSAGGLIDDSGQAMSGSRADKGKGRADDQDLFALDDDEGDEDLGRVLLFSLRLISAIRDSTSTGVGGATALDREFDKSIADELDAFDPDLMENLTVGVKGRKRGKRGGRRRAAADIEPSPEVKRLLGQANQAYAMGSLPEAIELLSEVVRIDPIIRVSWYTLATIYEELEDREKAVQCKIVATHLMGKQGASDWADLGRECRDIGLLHQAIYCFTQAIKGNKEDVDAMWDRAILLKLSGATNMAIRAFLALLSLLPHDPGVLRELAPLLASTEQYPRATALLLSAFTHYRELVPLVTPDTVGQLNTYGYADLETLADFLLVQRQHAEVVRVVRQGVRWLQGREREGGWDDAVDDREYDEVRKTRPGWEKANIWFEEAGTYELDVRLRSRLGLARLGMGMIEEAQHHFDIVTAEEVAEFPELFGAIGEAYFNGRMFEDALAIYHQMSDNEETNGATVWFKIGQCHQAMGELDDARECFENVVEEEPSNLEAKLALAKCLEQSGDPQRALVLIKQVIAARETTREESLDVDADGKPRRRTYLSREERAAARVHRENVEHERHAEFQIAFSRLQELDAAVLNGDEDALNQWLEIAAGLVDSFRSTKQLFPSDYKRKFMGVLRLGKKRGRKPLVDVEEEADHMASRLQRTLIADEDNEVEETSFRGLDFDGWVDFVLKYCFRLTLVDEIELAAEVLLHIRDAGVFRQDESREQALRLGLIACYLHAGMHEQVQKEARWFLLGRQFQTEPVRFLLALLSKQTSAIEAFNDSRLSKFFLRQLKATVQLVHGGHGAPATASSPVASRKGKERAVDPPAEDEDDGDGGEEDEDVRPRGGERFTPTQLSPVLFTTYGHMLLDSLSYQSAIIYYLRAYEIDKTQPLINLALATAYLQRSMSRKTDNRQHQIAQAFAFLEQYRKHRGDCLETEYNLARAFHHLGLQTHAVEHYERVLRRASAPAPGEADRMPVDGEPAPTPAPAAEVGGTGVAKAAAYNLALLYAMTGTPELARGVAERWLAV
ncbi:transcription factor TFIIIC subunit tfc4 [Rhodotorula kratochvilovae]